MNIENTVRNFQFVKHGILETSFAIFRESIIFGKMLFLTFFESHR